MPCLWKPTHQEVEEPAHITLLIPELKFPLLWSLSHPSQRFRLVAITECHSQFPLRIVNEKNNAFPRGSHLIMWSKQIEKLLKNTSTNMYRQLEGLLTDNRAAGGKGTRRTWSFTQVKWLYSLHACGQWSSPGPEWRLLLRVSSAASTFGTLRSKLQLQCRSTTVLEAFVTPGHIKMDICVEMPCYSH